MEGGRSTSTESGSPDRSPTPGRRLVVVVAIVGFLFSSLIAVRVPEGVRDVEEYLVSGIQPDAISWLDADTPVHAALKAMRETRNHLAVVTDGDPEGATRPGGVVGVITLADVLRRLFPQPA
mgnify:CR=1 FL=1